MKPYLELQGINRFRNWTRSASIPGMDQTCYISILSFVLREQDSDGTWTLGGSKWSTVMTAIIVKALATLEFGPRDQWPTKGGVGGMSSAVDALSARVGDSNPLAIGEDIWDACQTALALQKFRKDDLGTPLARNINGDWNNLYQSSLNAAEPIRWCGPAYLAAIVEVIGAYDADLTAGSKYLSAYNALSALGTNTTGPQNEAQTYFRAASPAGDMNFWSTSLTLRALSTPPPRYKTVIAPEQITRISTWLLDQLKSGTWKREADTTEKPMLLARTLQSLRIARLWLDKEIQQTVDTAIEYGNREIADSFRGASPLGNLKAYSAVLEYLADWTVPVPAGILFHASKGLEEAFLLRTEPRAIDGGLRIAWISDLHIAADHDPEPGYFNPLRRFAGQFMHMNGTPMSRFFQLRNVQSILDRLKTMRPNHILITGDMTNYAREGQFKSVHGQLLSVQAAILGEAALNPGELDAKLWTILPGNHDVTTEKAANCVIRKNLGLFFQWFGSTLDPNLRESGYDDAFPLEKTIGTGNGRLSVRLFGLDSTVSFPVWQVGVNARGRIDVDQKGRLLEKLARRSPSDLTLVALHHHPIVVPELISAVSDYFLSLDEREGRALIQMCATNDVSAILHGHFHRFSSWSGRTPQKQQLAIIGSPAGSLVVPETDIEFLEFREAEHETQNSMQEGLALYSHKMVDRRWTVSFAGTFLPKRERPR
jgi:3',5'-cyclic AMP phosphodiesterase CpdA